MNSSGRVAALSLAAVLVACGSSGNDGGSGAQQNCTPVNACHEGMRDSSGACVDLNVAVADGTACGTQMVCSAGTCVAACVAGQTCQSANPCKSGATTCASAAAAPVCSESGNLPDGTSCGNGNVCSAGSCVAPLCTVGLDCQPDNLCTNGTTTCQTPLSAPGCTVTDNKPDGTACGTDHVCSGGACLPVVCTPGTACDPADPCDVGHTVCTSPTTPGTCSTTGTKPDGTSCGTGLVCGAGTCVPACVAGQACQPPNPCATGTTACASSWATATCNITGSKPNGTSCGTGLVCSAGTCVAADTTRPTVVSRTPGPGATNVWARDAITVRFSEKMAASTFGDHSVILAASGGLNLAKTVSLSSDGLVLTITPLSLPVLPTSLTVQLTSAITDLAANPLVVPADSWQWHLPAWQDLGTVPFKMDDCNMAAIPSTDATSVPWVGVGWNGLHGSGILVFRWQDGWHDLTPPGFARGFDGQYLGASLDTRGSGDVAVSWVEDLDDGGPPQAFVMLRSGSAWTAAAQLGGGEIGMETLVRFDPHGRAVVAWVSGPMDVDGNRALQVKRQDRASWPQLGDTQRGTFQLPYWDLSFADDGEPQYVWDSGSDEYYRYATLRRWDGSTWSAPRFSEWDYPAPSRLIPRITAGGESFAAWWAGTVLRTSRHRNDYDVADTPIDIFSGGGRGAPYVLDARGYPVAVWVENGVVCGKRWQGLGWEPLASELPCTGYGRTASLDVAPTGDVLACVITGDPSDSSLWPKCARYNEYSPEGIPVPLTSILINEAQGATTEIPFPTAFRVAFTPANATTKTLTWRVCADHPVACTPDPTGHCRTCTPSTTNGTITSSGVYTPPATVPASPTRVYVTACQVEQAICDWSYVDVYR